MSFTNKTVFITGSSRGIWKATALRFTKESANVIIVAKSIEEDESLGGTIYTAKEVEEAGGKFSSNNFSIIPHCPFEV